jgi:hypothetical protein
MMLAASLALQAAKSVDDVDDCGSWSVTTTVHQSMSHARGAPCIILTLCLSLPTDVSMPEDF